MELLGLASYPTYLFHGPLLLLVGSAILRWRLVDDWRITWLILVVVGISAGITLGYMAERPIMNRRAAFLGRLRSRQSQPVRREVKVPVPGRAAMSIEPGVGCMTVAICFTNFGPYHLARLRALATRLAAAGSRLIAYEVAGREQIYPWSTDRRTEPFEWITFFPDRTVESVCTGGVPAGDAPGTRAGSASMRSCLVGYARPESMTAAAWARRRGCPVILFSESQSIDRTRVWWKELIKMRRVRQFDAALVGGPAHRDYLVQLGMPADRIALGYNAVDNRYFATEADRWREARKRPHGRARGSLFPDGMPVCSREKPGPADRGVCPLSQAIES